MNDEENEVVWDKGAFRRIRDGSRIKPGTVLRFPDERSPSPLADKLVIYRDYFGPVDTPSLSAQPHFVFEVEGSDEPLMFGPDDLTKTKLIEVR